MQLLLLYYTYHKQIHTHIHRFTETDTKHIFYNYTTNIFTTQPHLQTLHTSLLHTSKNTHFTIITINRREYAIGAGIAAAITAAAGTRLAALLVHFCKRSVKNIKR